METIKIKVADYYNHPEYYQFMPREIFNALEKAELEGRWEKREALAEVPKLLFDKMWADFNDSKTAALLKHDEPECYLIGNLIYEKKYIEAIELGKALLEKFPFSNSVHVNLMDAYFKARDENEDYLSRSTYHATQAMLLGHNTGHVQKRLSINLEKDKKYHQAIQLYDIILSPKFTFSSHGIGTKKEYVNRKKSLITKVHKSTDSELDILFDAIEIEQIFINSKIKLL